MKANSLNPTNLIHPILPMNGNNDLRFHLCYTYVSTEELEEECTSTDEERAFIHTYYTSEIGWAMNSGYDTV